MPPPRREEAETMYGLLQQSRLSIISREAFEADLARQEAILKKVRHAVLV
jgi:hypothetical protein